MTTPIVRLADEAVSLRQHADDHWAAVDALERLPMILAELDATLTALTEAEREANRLAGMVAERDITIADLQRQLAEGQPVPVGIRYGVNAQGTGYANPPARLAMFGKIGVQRYFYPTMLPARWDPTSPEREAHVSFKVPPREFAAGQHDAAFLAWCATVPTGWWVLITLYHEANDELRGGVFTEADFKAAYKHMTELVRSRQWAGTVKTAVCFMAYLVDQAGWADSWVPPVTDVDYLVWDIYGNPQGGPGVTGKGIDQTPYRPPSFYADPCYRVTKRLGYSGRWGVTEHNSPWRTWDPQEMARVEWFKTFHADIAADKFAIGQPVCVLLWEDDTSVNWQDKQKFWTDATRGWWAKVIA